MQNQKEKLKNEEELLNLFIIYLDTRVRLINRLAGIGNMKNEIEFQKFLTSAKIDFLKERNDL